MMSVFIPYDKTVREASTKEKWAIERKMVIEQENGTEATAKER